MYVRLGPNISYPDDDVSCVPSAASPAGLLDLARHR